MPPDSIAAHAAPAPGSRPAQPSPGPHSTSPTPTHGCVRCGAEVPLDVALCENCNPLGLKDPASSQVHGSVLLAIVVGVVILAVVGRLSLNGIGPFTGRVVGVISNPSPPGLSVSVEVRNAGSRAGIAQCRLYDPGAPGIGPESTTVQSPRVEPGQTTTFSALMTTLGTTVRPVGVDCVGP